MQNAKNEQDQQRSQHEATQLREEVAALATRYAALEQESHGSSKLMQKLGRAFGFGAAGKLEWAHFKLKFKQEQLARSEAQPGRMDGPAKHAGMTAELQPSAPVRETAQQKLERMIKENPAALEPELRRIYQPLIEAEQQQPGIG